MFLVGLFILTRTEPRDRSPWVAAARKLSLTAEEEGFSGVLRTLPVTARLDGQRVVFQIGPVDRLVEGLDMRALQDRTPEGAESRAMTGDPIFDRQVAVLGPRHEVTVVMDWETRQRIATMVRDLNLVVSEGMFHATLHSADHSGALLAGEATALVTLARRLRFRPESAADRLFDNAAEDPKPQVRARNLEALLERFPDSELAREGARRARTDPDPRVRALVE